MTEEMAKPLEDKLKKKITDLESIREEIEGYARENVDVGDESWMIKLCSSELNISDAISDLKMSLKSLEEKR